MSTLIDRLNRHLDDIDPTRAHARVGIQCGLAIALALLALRATPLWPDMMVWAGAGVLLPHIAVASRTGTFRHEAVVMAGVALAGAVTLVAGTFAHAETVWFLPAVAVVGFVTGLGIGFDVVGRKIGILAFLVFALAATIGGPGVELAERSLAGAVGLAASLVALLLFHLLGHVTHWADFGRPLPPQHVFHLFPAIDRSTLLHALRMATTVLVASALAEALGVAHPLWMMLTIAVVLQRRLGETLIKGAQRLSGTVVGAIVGWAIASLVGPEHAVWLLLLIPVALVGRYLYVPANYAVGMAFATTFVILVYSALGRPLAASALERLLDTLIAAGIGIIVSLVLIPERAAEDARRALMAFIRAAAAHYADTLAAALGRPPADFAQKAQSFETQAASLTKEMVIAQWEAMPGRRIFGLRREVRAHLGAIYRHIRDLEQPVDAAGTIIASDAEAALEAEAVAIHGLFAELETSVRDRRGPPPEAFEDGTHLLAAARSRPLPFADRRVPLIEELIAFLHLQARRFPPDRAGDRFEPADGHGTKAHAGGG